MNPDDKYLITFTLYDMFSFPCCTHMAAIHFHLEPYATQLLLLICKSMAIYLKGSINLDVGTIGLSYEITEWAFLLWISNCLKTKQKVGINEQCCLAPGSGISSSFGVAPNLYAGLCLGSEICRPCQRSGWNTVLLECNALSLSTYLPQSPPWASLASMPLIFPFNMGLYRIRWWTGGVLTLAQEHHVSRLS